MTEKFLSVETLIAQWRTGVQEVIDKWASTASQPNRLLVRTLLRDLRRLVKHMDSITPCADELAAHLKARPAEQSVYESCQCPAKPGEPCPLNETECANRVKKALAVRYLDRAANLSGCSWDCHVKYVSAGFDACCSKCQNIALAMVDAMTDGRYLTLTLNAQVPVVSAPPAQAPTDDEEKGTRVDSQ